MFAPIPSASVSTTTRLNPDFHHHPHIRMCKKRPHGALDSAYGISSTVSDYSYLNATMDKRVAHRAGMDRHQARRRIQLR
jgi:hypothetical protein